MYAKIKKATVWRAKVDGKTRISLLLSEKGTDLDHELEMGPRLAARIGRLLLDKAGS